MLYSTTLTSTKLALEPLKQFLGTTFKRPNNICNEGMQGLSGYSEQDEIKLMREIRRRLRQFAEEQKAKKGQEIQKSIRDMFGGSFKENTGKIIGKGLKKNKVVPIKIQLKTSGEIVETRTDANDRERSPKKEIYS